MLQFFKRSFSSSSLLEVVSKLRDETALSMNLCRKAAVESNLDYNLAIQILSKSVNGSFKPSSTGAFNFGKEGLIGIMGSSDRKFLLELRCDSDFVAQNPEFINLADSILTSAVGSTSEEIKTLLSTQSSNKLIQESLDMYRSKFRENIGIESIKMLEANNSHKPQYIGHYIHQRVGSNTGKIGSIVQIVAENGVKINDLEDIGNSLARQAVALNNPKVDMTSLINSEYLFSRIGTVRNFIESFEDKLNSKISILDLAYVRIK